MSAETIEPTTPLEKYQAAELARLREAVREYFRGRTWLHDPAFPPALAEVLKETT